MKNVFLLILCGIFGGIIGGMGMGGGTLFIPLLTVVCGVEQKIAQSVNLISFLPMALIAVVIHIKNRLINFDYVFWLATSGILTCFFGCLFAAKCQGEALKRAFGVFLLIIAAIKMLPAVFGSAKRDKNKR